MESTTERTLSVWEGRVKPKVVVAGHGAPLIYLHGMFGLVWDSFLDALAREYTVYAPETPGSSTDDPDGIRALDDLWDLVLYYYELFDQLKLERPAVVGHDFGAMVAAELAATDPARVRKLVLISALGLWRDENPIRNAAVTPAADLLPLLFDNPENPAAAKLFPALEDADGIIRHTWAVACACRFMWPLPDKGLKKRAHRIKAPTLIVWGANDRLVAPVYAEEFRSRIAGSRVELVDHASHMVTMEQPEAVAKLVREFCHR